ncbi:amine oxidase [Plakobranchus ocellatus]|uniref:Amine oxidase n=1 Tax=Plakobranchus ocellatus TaxID=259542 RepID=A0AAV4DSU9_9GAST|nr:amine oxidase [Plakobranchus ocellatus]
MAVGNLGKPNAKTNTHLIGIAYVKDTHENLKIFMTDVNTKITQLQNTEWNVKRIVVFLHGDCDFLCKVFGLSGPQGTYPCLWCLTTKKELQESTEKEPRTLAFLKSAFEKFKIESGEDKRKAAQYHKCIHKPLIDIELHKVSPPYLHIPLGVILKHHQMLEQAADRIDKQIYEDKNPDRADNSCLLSNLGNNWKKWMQKQKEIAFFKGCVAFGEAESSSQTWMEQLEKAQEVLETISHTPLTSRPGPVCSQLDAVLDKHAIPPQSYYSCSFTGNQCNKYLLLSTPRGFQRHHSVNSQDNV